jgi:hypothetical protein
MQAIHEPNLSAMNAIQSILRKLENAWNSADLTTLAGLFLDDAWIIDSSGSIHRHITEQVMPAARLLGCIDDACYCVLIIEQILFLAEEIGYVVAKMNIRDGDAETRIEGRCVMIFRPAPSTSDWRIQLLHLSITKFHAGQI